jgi:hypothetical protein
MSIKVKYGRCKICGKETTLTHRGWCIDCATKRYLLAVKQMVLRHGPLYEKYLYKMKLARERYPHTRKKKVKGVVRRKGKTRT